MAVDCDPFNAPQLPPWLPGPVLRPAVVFECVDGPSVIESIVTLRLSTGEPYVWSAISSFPLRSQKVRRAEPESICIGGDGSFGIRAELLCVIQATLSQFRIRDNTSF